MGAAASELAGQPTEPMASDGAQRKNQRRFVLIVNIVLFCLGLVIFRFDLELMHDALFIADRQFGWILWLSFAAGCVTLLLSFIGD